MEEVNLGSKGNGQRYFGNEASGGTSTSDVPSRVIAQTKEVLKHLNTLHLWVLFEMGSIRAVDRVLAKQVMAHFARVNLVMGEDLNISLWELVTVMEEAGMFLDCACQDACVFLKEQVSAMESSEELQELTRTLSEWLGNHECQVWNVVMGPEMMDPHVST